MSNIPSNGNPTSDTTDIVVIDAADAMPPLANAALVFRGDYERLGSDLFISHPDHGSLRLVGYFAQDNLPDIHTLDGAVLGGRTVAQLAGPLAPGAYAQAGAGLAGTPIGNVQTASGTVTAQRTDGTTVTLSVGDPVFQGDVVETSGDSSLIIVFADDTLFSLSADARMVLDELIYSPNGSDNSMVMNLVQGSFVFVTGQVAPTGDMRIETPTATMGIRGTTPIVEINALDGATRFSLTFDPDGTLGAFQLFDRLTGQLVGTVDTTTSSLLVPTAGAAPVVLPRTQQDIDAVQNQIQEAFTAYGNAGLGQSSPDDGDDNGNGETQPDGGPDQTDTGPPVDAPLPDLTPLDGDNGGLDGQRSELPGTNNGLGLLSPGGSFSPVNTFQSASTQTPQPQPQNGAPPSPPILDNLTVILPSSSVVTIEDQSISLSGLNVVIPGNGQGVVTLIASSTVTLAQITGLTFLEGDGFDDEIVRFTGSEADINAALSGMLYTPSPNSEVGGLFIRVDDGQMVREAQLPITIQPVDDPPIVYDIALTVSESGAVTAPFLGEDPDPGDTLTLFSVSPPSLGTLEVFDDGTFTFDTNGDFDSLAAGATQDITFEYLAVDSTGLVSNVPGVVTITVVGENGDPVPGPPAKLIDSFENGLGAWNFAVNATIESDSTEGVASVRLSTENDPLISDPNAVVHTPGVISASEVEQRFGLEDGIFNELAGGTTDDGITTGSALFTKLTHVSAGDIVTFDWRLSSNDYVREDGFVFNDSGYVIFDDTVLRLSGVAELGNLNGDFSTTGWQTSSFVAPVSGSLQIGFAVFDYSDNDVDSFLDIDNIRLGSNVTASVTEFSGNSANAGTGQHSVSGTISFTDADPNDTHTVSVAALGDNYLGNLTQTISVPSTGGDTGTVTWNFVVDDADLDQLAQDETVVQKYSVTIDDGNGGTFSQTVTIELNGANEAPVIDLTGMSGTTTTEETPLTISGIVVADADAGSDPLEVSLSVSNGALDMTGAAGLTLLDADGSDGMLSFTGSQADINSALVNSVLYTPEASFIGTETLVIDVSDQAGLYAQSNIAAVDIAVEPVIDPPIVIGGLAIDDNGLTYAPVADTRGPSRGQLKPVDVPTTGTALEVVTLLPSGTVTYSFPSVTQVSTTLTTYAPAQQAAAVVALALWADVSGLSIAEAADGEPATISFLNSTEVSFAETFGTDSGSVILTNPGFTENLSPDAGTFGFLALLHGTGNALGMDHAPAALTQVQSVMSSVTADKVGVDWWNENGVWVYSQTPMIEDIAAVQSAYGANDEARAGDTVYGFNSTETGTVYDYAANKDPVLTIYDADGIDVLDFSGWDTPSVINLNPGTYSSVNGMTNNIGIAYGTQIEKAIGGAGDDLLIGTSLGETLDGGPGQDTLIGGDGADVFVLAHTDAADIVVDFQTGLDRLDLSSLLDANFGTQDSTDYIQVERDGGDAVLSVDRDGSGSDSGFREVAVLQSVDSGGIIDFVFSDNGVQATDNVVA